jgi:hypothetical protein
VPDSNDAVGVPEIAGAALEGGTGSGEGGGEGAGAGDGADGVGAADGAGVGADDGAGEGSVLGGVEGDADVDGSCVTGVVVDSGSDAEAEGSAFEPVSDSPPQFARAKLMAEIRIAMRNFLFIFLSSVYALPGERTDRGRAKVDDGFLPRLPAGNPAIY